MQRYLFRVTYTRSDGSQSYESVCVRAATGDETAVRTEVDGATERYRAFVGATKTLTLLLVTADA